MEKHEVEIWLAVDSEGNAATSVESGDDARDTLSNADDYSGIVRTVKLRAALALPQETEAAVDISDEAGELAVAAE